jgi:hypothetical protein
MFLKSSSFQNLELVITRHLHVPFLVLQTLLHCSASAWSLRLVINCSCPGTEVVSESSVPWHEDAFRQYFPTSAASLCWVFVAPRVHASAHPMHQRTLGLRLEQTPKSNFWDPLGPRTPYCMLGPLPPPPLYLLFYHVPLPLFTIHLTHLCPTQLDTCSLLL